MQLGVHLDFRVPDDIPRLTSASREAGFTAIQAFLRGLDVDIGTVDAIRESCETAGLEIAAAAVYANPLRPDDAPMGANRSKEARLARLLLRLGAPRLVIWSGTAGDSIETPDPRNQEPESWARFLAHVRTLLEPCTDAGAQLLVEPHAAHVLGTVEACERFCAEIATDRVALVLDPPNLVAPESFEKRDAVVDDVLKKLGRRTGLVHFRDHRPRSDGRVEAVAPGAGVLDYKRFATGIVRSGYAGVGIVECIDERTMAEARRFVLPFVESI